MSVDNLDVIDIVATVRETGEVVMSITDHLSWRRHDHLVVLEAKINRYLEIIESNHLAEVYPRAKPGVPVRIDVICKYTPSPDGLRFLELARESVVAGGWGFSWSSPPPRRRTKPE